MSGKNSRVVILASGDVETREGGTTANRVIRDSLDGEINFNVGLVICNNGPDKVAVHSLVEAINKDYGLKGDAKIDVVTINSKTHPGGPQERGQTLEESAAIHDLAIQRDCGFMALLGYLKVLNGQLIEEWGWQPSYGQQDPIYNGIYHPNSRILNNHPSILPFTAGKHGHGAHLEAIDLYRAGRIDHSAMTWHLASAEVDIGALVRVEMVPIYNDDDADSLGVRVQDVEKALTAAVIDNHLIMREEQLRQAA